jgi:hypothetical protein
MTKIHARIGISDWLTVNCRLVDTDLKEGDDDMVTPEELEAARRLLDSGTPLEENDVDDFDIDYQL